MSVSDFALLAVAAFTAISFTLAYAVISREKANFRAAKALAWMTGAGLWSLGIIWATTAGEYAMTVRVIAAGAIGGLAAAGLAWVLIDINEQAKAAPKIHEQPVQPVTGNGNVVVNGNNRGTVIGTQNNTTINHPTRVFGANTNEGVLTPAHLPTPPLPEAMKNGPPLPNGALKVFFGSNLAWATRMPHTVLVMAGEPMIVIDRKKSSDELVVSVLRIFDDRDNIIARIDEDGFWVENSTRKKRPDPHTLVVFDHTDTEVLRITFLNKDTISVTGVFRHAGIGRPVIITQDAMNMGGMTMTGSVMGESGADIVIGDRGTGIGAGAP